MSKRYLTLFSSLTLMSIAHIASATWNSDGNAIYPGALAESIGSFPISTSDGAGGIYTCWTDSRYGNLDVFVQHMDQNGDIVTGWPSTGIDVCPLLGEQENPKLA